MPYNSPHSATISALMLAKGNALADADLRAGQAWGGLASGLGNIIGGSAAQLAQWNEAKPQRDLTQLQLKDANLRVGTEQRATDQDLAIKQAWTEANGDGDAAAKLLESRGFGEAALGLKSKLSTLRTSAIAEQANNLNLTITKLKAAQSLIPEPPSFKGNPNDIMSGATEAANFSAQYASALPHVQKILGDDLGGLLPQPNDPDLIQKVQKLHEFGTSALDRLKIRNEALEAAAKVMSENARTNKTNVERLKDLAPILKTYIGKAQTQDDWDWAVNSWQGMGGDPQMIPATFTPGNQKIVGDALGAFIQGDKPDSPLVPVPGPKGTVYGTRESAVGQPVPAPPQQPSQELYPVVETKPDGTKVTVYKPRTGAIDQPVGSHPGTGSAQSEVVDEVTRRGAETWKANQKSRLELEKRKGGTQEFNPASGKWETVPTMTDAVYKAELQRIEDGYQALIKQPGRSLTPPAPVAPVAPVTPPAAGAAPKVTDPAVRERAKQLLRDNHFGDTDANVDTFLKDPVNRAAVGLH